MSQSQQPRAIGTGDAATGRGLTGSGPLASFVRFVVCGGGVSLIASAIVPSVASVMPWVLANALITVVSTLLCTELHSLITFRTGGWAGLRRHLQSAGSAAASYAVTTIAVLVLHALQPSAGRLLEQAVYLGAAGLAGIGRFVVLRLLVFADRTDPARSQADEATAQGRGTEQAVARPGAGRRPVVVPAGWSPAVQSGRALPVGRRRVVPSPALRGPSVACAGERAHRPVSARTWRVPERLIIPSSLSTGPGAGLDSCPTPGRAAVPSPGGRRPGVRAPR